MKLPGRIAKAAEDARVKGHFVLKDQYATVRGEERLGFILQRLQRHGVLRLLIERAECGKRRRFPIALRQQRVHSRKVALPPGAEESMRYIGGGFQIRDRCWVVLQGGDGRRSVIDLLSTSDQEEDKQ